MSRDHGLIVGAVGISALGDFLLWIPLTLHILELERIGRRGHHERLRRPAFEFLCRTRSRASSASSPARTTACRPLRAP